LSRNERFKRGEWFNELQRVGHHWEDSGAHGIRGELRLLPLTDFPDRFNHMNHLNVYRPNGSFWCRLTINSLREHVGKKQFIVGVDEIADRDEAENLRGGIVMIDPEERVELPEGFYWVDDLIGLDVMDVEGGDRLGVLVEIMPTGSNDVYVVEACDGKRHMLPAISEVVKEINVEEGFIKVHLMEGLWSSAF